MGILGVLLVAFIILKAIGLITWSWWLVLTPLYIWIILFMLLSMFAGYLATLGIRLPYKANKKRK